MICGIIQSSYIPWRGYFDFIHDCDVFVFHDDIPYTKQDWRNRNRIKTQSGLKWLTVPVGRVPTRTLIDQVAITDPSWSNEHLKFIKINYWKAPYFDPYFKFLESLYKHPWRQLAELNRTLTIEIARSLDIRAKFICSSDLNVSGEKTDRIARICREVGADHYLSGPSARAYLDEERLNRHGIQVSYKVYDYPHYPQLHGSFEPQVSIIDLLFNCGARAPEWIWGSLRGNDVPLHENHLDRHYKL